NRGLLGFQRCAAWRRWGWSLLEGDQRRLVRSRAAGVSLSHQPQTGDRDRGANEYNAINDLGICTHTCTPASRCIGLASLVVTCGGILGDHEEAGDWRNS